MNKTRDQAEIIISIIKNQEHQIFSEYSKQNSKELRMNFKEEYLVFYNKVVVKYYSLDSALKAYNSITL